MKDRPDLVSTAPRQISINQRLETRTDCYSHHSAAKKLALTMRRFTTRQLEAFIFFFAIVVCAVSSSVSNQTIDDVNDVIPADDEEAERQRLLNTAREASAKLRSYLRGVRVAKEQIAPLTTRNDSQPTVNLSLSFSLSLSLSFLPTIYHR